MGQRMPHVLRDDSGIAMLVVIGVMSVVTVLAVSSFVLARHSLHESARVEDSSRAYRVASSALEAYIGTITEDQVANFPSGGITGTTSDGSFILTLEDIGANEFELRSVGTGVDDTQQTVRQRFFFLNLWKMNISAGSDDSLITGGNAMAGNSHITGPFYTKGILSVGQGMTISEGPLFVKSGQVPDGIAEKGGTYYLGHELEPIDVFCEGGIPEGGGSAHVHVGSHSVSVPDIMLPPLLQDHLDQWAELARQQSVDNVMGGTSDPNLEVADPLEPESYSTVFPRVTATSVDVVDENPHYKFFGKSSGSVSTKGEGQTEVRIGDKAFGAWGALSDVSGHIITSGVSGYPAGQHDDFAYDADNDILYISGTVFVDGPVRFTRSMKYVGNGTIVANGDITVDGYLRPYHASGESHIERGETNEWALGLVTPGNLHLNYGGSNPGAPGSENPRDTVAPLATYAGAFYAEGKSNFNSTNQIFVGSLLTGEMVFGGDGGGATNKYIVTNPLLPNYLPESLPGGDVSMILPTHWSRD